MKRTPKTDKPQGDRSLWHRAEYFRTQIANLEASIAKRQEALDSPGGLLTHVRHEHERQNARAHEWIAAHKRQLAGIEAQIAPNQEKKGHA